MESSLANDIPPARGRIIRKPIVFKRTAPHGSGRALSIRYTELLSDAHWSICLKALMLSVPIILAVLSGGDFLHNKAGHRQKPMPYGDRPGQSISAVDDRFEKIGTELYERFSAAPIGVVIKPTMPLEAIPEAKIPQTSVPVSQIIQPGGDKTSSGRLALEEQVYKILRKHGRPTQGGKELASAIVSEALLQGYDPVFVAAVIKSESAFNALARSHKGAQGLMQIMPKTGAWLADKNALPRRSLTDPGHNLKLGISYLKQLEDEYKGNRVLTLIAYNWGPGHVELASRGTRQVPGEVMQYAVKILNDYRRWSSEIQGAFS